MKIRRERKNRKINLLENELYMLKKELEILKIRLNYNIGFDKKEINVCYFNN